VAESSSENQMQINNITTEMIIKDNTTKSKTRPHITISQDENQHYISCFGFELKNLKRTDSANLEQLLNNCIQWHKRFFNAISNSPLNCTIRFIIRNDGDSVSELRQPLCICILFYIKSEKLAALEENNKLLINDLMVLFGPEITSVNDPYSFAAITDSNLLSVLHNKKNEVNVYEYKRKPVFFQKQVKELGYKKIAQTENETIEFLPQSFLPDFTSQNNIIQYIYETDHFMEISVTLAPLKFQEKKRKRYKTIYKEWQITDESFTKAESEAYNNYLEMTLDNNTSVFYLKVALTTSANHIYSQSLHNIISDTFFGNIENVDVDAALEENNIPFFKESDTDSILPYIYPKELALLSFRLPVPTADEYMYFSNKTNIFNYVPFNLPKEGVKLGVKKTLKHQKEIYIHHCDLSRHAYILGQTGVGKTTLLKTMIMDQIHNGEGVCVVDPHGDLVNEIADKIPENRKKDTIFFDPTTSKDIRINIIEVHPDFPEQRTFIFNEFMKLFSEIYNMSMVAGPAFEQYFKNALFLVIEKGGILEDIYKFFLDADYRNTLLYESKQKYSVDFFRNAEKIQGEWSFEAFAGYITSKINRFVQDDFIGPLISSPKSTINFRELIDNKQILLVRLPKGRLGSDGVAFIGSIIFNRIIMAAYTRENVSANQRTPYNLYVDEFQNFTSEDVITALSESRKYGLRLILANQTLGQLKPQIIDIILGNVGSQIIFRPGILDIDKLHPYYNHHISVQELLNLPNFYAVARLLNNDAPLKPFILETTVL